MGACVEDPRPLWAIACELGLVAWTGLGMGRGLCGAGAGPGSAPGAGAGPGVPGAADLGEGVSRIGPRAARMLPSACAPGSDSGAAEGSGSAWISSWGLVFGWAADLGLAALSPGDLV